MEHRIWGPTKLFRDPWLSNILISAWLAYIKMDNTLEEKKVANFITRSRGWDLKNLTEMVFAKRLARL